MTNLFTEAGKNPYSTLELDAPVQAEVAPSRTAQLAAMAEVDISAGGAELVGDIETLTQKYRDMIDIHGDKGIRAAAAGKQLEAELTGINTAMLEAAKFGDQESQDYLFQAAQNTVQQGIERRETYALEQKAIEKIQDLAASGDRTQAKLQLNNLELGDSMDVLRDMDTKRLILQREVEKAQIAVEDQGWFFDVVNALAEMIPANISAGGVGNVDVEAGVKNWYDNIFSGERRVNESAALFNMNPADFSEYVSTTLIPNVKENSTILGMQSNAEYLDILTQLAGPRAALRTNLGDAFNNGTAVGVGSVVKGGRALVSAPSLLVRNGARKQMAETLAKFNLDAAMEGTDAAVKKSGITIDEAIDNITPTALSPGGPASTVSVTANVSADMERAATLTAKIQELTATSRFVDEGELTKAIEKVVKDTAETTGRELKDWSKKTVTLGDQSTVNNVEMTLGKKDGHGYASKRTAQGAAESLGYDTAEVIQDESGQWFFKISKPVRETGSYTNPLMVQEDSIAWRLLGGARSVGDLNLADMAQVAGSRWASLMQEVFQPFVKPFQALKAWEREPLSQILMKGSNESRWYTEDEFNILNRAATGRDATEAQITAYNAYRDLNDIEWSLRNDEVYKAKVTRGLETANFDTPLGPVKNVDARIDRKLDDIGKVRTYDASNGQHFTKQNPLTENRLQQLKAEGFVVLNLDEPVRLADGTEIKRFLVKGSDLSITPLAREQLAYQAGGHRMYKSKYFVKQARKGVQGDTLEEYFKSPSTFIGGTRKEAEQWAAKMEQARLAYKEMVKSNKIDPTELDEIFGGRKGYPSGEEFIKGIRDGDFDANHPFEALFDRELPSAYREANESDIAFNTEESGFNGWLASNGRMFYSGRGEALKDFKGDVAPTLDPFETANRALQNVANIVSFSDYKMSSLERWNKAFKRFTNFADLGDDTSASVIFRDAQWKPGTPDKIKQAGQAQKDIIQRTLGFKTQGDLQAEQFTRRMSEWAFSAEPGTARAKAERIVADWWNETNPVTALRSAAFDMKLGLFNVAQLPLQVSTAVAAMTLSPIHGAHGFTLYAPLRAFLANGNEAMLETLVKNGAVKQGFKSADDMKEMFRSAKRSGFFNIGGSHELMADYGPNATLDGFAKGTQKVREAGRFFFNEAEIFNRSVAWNIAWKETSSQFPDLATKSAEFQRRVAGAAEKYSFNMSKTSEAWWQKGVLSIPTQFWGYQARMLEMMFGKQITTSQRIRLMTVQTMMYGTAGLPVLPYISEKLKGNAGEAPDINTFFGTVDRGLLDRVIYEMTGADIALGKKYGTGAWITDTVRDLFGAGAYGEKSFAEVAGGATFGIMGQTGGTFYDVIRHMVAESSGEVEGPVDPESFKRMALNISTVSNVFKAWYIFQYGTFRSNKGSASISGLPPANGIAVLLGFQPGQQDDISAMMNYQKHEAEIVKEASRIYANYRQRMVNEPQNRQEIAQDLAAFSRTLPPDLRKKVIMKTGRDVDPSMYDGLVKQRDARNLKNDG